MSRPAADSMQQQTPAQLRSSYRRNAATFLSSSITNFNDSSTTTSWTDEAARSLALRAVYRTAWYGHGTDLHHPHPTIHHHDDEGNHWKEFVCLTCGTVSPHPNDATSLRTLQRGRTRRRRSSRSRAEQHRREDLYKRRIQSCGGGNTNSTAQSAVREDMVLRRAEMREANRRRIGDGRSRHCVVRICGFCGTETKKKGVELTNNTKKTGTTKERQQKKPSESNRQGIMPTKGARKRADDESLDECNFISLPDSKRKHSRAVTSKQAAQVTETPSFSFKTKQSPLVSGGKKKKKKKGPPAGSKLMDFLSSLND